MTIHKLPSSTSQNPRNVMSHNSRLSFAGELDIGQHTSCMQQSLSKGTSTGLASENAQKRAARLETCLGGVKPCAEEKKVASAMR